MPLPEQSFRWTWDLDAPPGALWPLVSNTDRFNRDCGYPPVTVRPSPSAHRRLQATVMGIVIEWEEQAFEWQEPWHYAVHREYYSGPVARMIMRCDLAPRAGGGTTLTYEMRLTPSGLLGRLALPLAIGHQARAVTERVFRRYDELAQAGRRISRFAAPVRLAPGAEARLSAARRQLCTDARQPAELVARLADCVTTADDLTCQRLRPYALAEEWGVPRRPTLSLFLHATRAGLLDFHWDVLCPHCRGAKATAATLGALEPAAHCETCHLDFTADFAQTVELTFTPNAAIRRVPRVDYCVGGPQVTPHVVAQQRLAPGETRPFVLALPPGRYRVRAGTQAAPRAFRLDPEAGPAAALALDPTPAAADEPALAPGGTLTVTNPAAESRLAVIEHVEWGDQATTASEVLALQLFRDLFAREVLRPGGQVSAGALTVVFTDLRNSTQLYQEIGDAPAFGRVLTHFEILKAAVAAEDGAIVKTMGDAILAVFPRPAAALRALIRAQRFLAAPDAYAPATTLSAPHGPHPLALKAGLHHGPCIAINQNDRLDYFGSTVNLAARLCPLATGGDIVLSAAVRHDPEVDALLASRPDALAVTPETTRLKGFDGAEFEVWRLRAKPELTREEFWRL